MGAQLDGKKVCAPYQLESLLDVAFDSVLRCKGNGRKSSRSTALVEEKQGIHAAGPYTTGCHSRHRNTREALGCQETWRSR